MKSLSFYLTLLAIKIKGIKSDFSREPINYRKLRKEDVHSSPFKGTKELRIKDSIITEIGSPSTSRLIIFIHGGAFVYGPAKHHWDTVKKLAEKTGFTVWLVNYPKAPENNISEISHNIDQVYLDARKRLGAIKIILVGDSVGGTLAVALVQRLIKKGNPLPSLLILISPVMDSSFKNEEISILEDKDPMLSRIGALSAKKMCSVNGDLEDPALSPVNGDFFGFPGTLLFIAENDITSPDQEILAAKLNATSVNHRVIRGKGMPHIWPILPVMKEGKAAFDHILTEIKKIKD